MSVISVTTINTPNTNIDLTIQTGNTSSGSVVLYSGNGNINVSSNTFTLNVGGTVTTLNSTSTVLGWQLLNTLTAANSVSLSDTTSFLLGYNDYEIVFTNIIPVTNDVNLGFQVQSNGSFQATSYVSTILFGSAGAASANDFTTSIVVSGQVINSVPGSSGWIRVSNVGANNTPKIWNGQQGQISTTFYPMLCAGMWNNNAPITGFQAIFGSGNILSGTIRVYGRK